MKDLILVCEDIFGLEVLAILDEMNRWHETRSLPIPYRILGYISDTERPFGDITSSAPRLGMVTDWKPLKNEYYVMGLKMPQDKKSVSTKLKQAGCRFETILTPWVITMPIPIGEGSVISAYTFKEGASTGKFTTVIGAMVSEYHIGDYSTVMRFANVIAPVGNETYVGNHVYGRLEKSIGDHCHLSDGSVVVNHVKPGTSVAGVPARKINR